MCVYVCVYARARLKEREGFATVLAALIALDSAVIAVDDDVCFDVNLNWYSHSRDTLPPPPTNKQTNQNQQTIKPKPKPKPPTPSKKKKKKKKRSTAILRQQKSEEEVQKFTSTESSFMRISMSQNT